MLQTLSITNYALISSVSLEFTPGLTIITGETGSGKSIMLGALALLQGGRADTKAISDKSRKSVIEAVFSKPDPELRSVFEESELEWNPEEIMVRREISASGRSRAFVNDSPVTLPVLSSVTERLIDIHSQHGNIQFSQGNGQLEVIDSYGSLTSLLDDYRSDFGRYVTLRTKIRRTREKFEQVRRERDFIMFQLEQLNKINPKEGELKKVEDEFDMLSDADQIRDDLSVAYGSLDGGDTSALSRLTDAMASLSKVNLGFFTSEEESAEIIRRFENLKIELKDLAETLGDYLDRVDSDPARLAKVTARMNLIYDAIKHFKVADEKALVDLHHELKRKIVMIDSGEEDISGLEQEARTLGRNLKQKAEKLTGLREEAAKRFGEELTFKATTLGLPNLRFAVEIKRGKLTVDGQDTVEFMCSFNKNHELQPMGKVASGGETARLMLCIKSIMARCMNLPTVIFDEVDTGVSGEIADKMGCMMKDMGSGMQVIAITHLPQVAAKGDSHFKVYKTDEEEKTVSHVRKLDFESRINELAGMLSGTEVNEAARMNARALLGVKE